MKRPKTKELTNTERLAKLAARGNVFAALALGLDPETGKPLETKKEK